MQSNWWQELERELEQQFDSFLKDHPAQQELLEQEEQRAKQQRRLARLSELETKAQDLRDQLLNLSEEIRGWRARVERAQRAGAHDLADRAQAHLSSLMGQGREQWQSLAALGEESRLLHEEISRAEKQSAKPPKSQAPTAQEDLEQAWQRFEAEQELERLRREQR
jgi:hercynine metabolism protein